jgi:hypothetical protein
MKKKILVVLSVLALATFAVAPVFAQIPSGTTTDPTGPSDINSIYQKLVIIIRWVYTLFLALTVLFFIMAAVSYLTSGGDPAKVKKANSKLIYAIVAIVVAILAFSLKTIIVNFIS